MDTVWLLLAAVGGVLAALFAAFNSGRKSGRDSVQAQQARKNDATRKEFDKIDSAAPDFDRSIDRLRERAGRDKSQTK